MKNFKEHNKLVRDKIPEILSKNGCQPEVEILSDADYVKLLNLKLLEEANEVVDAIERTDKIEELADLLEVVHALIDTVDTSLAEVEEVRLRKKEKRGGFAKKVLLKRALVVEKLQ